MSGLQQGLRGLMQGELGHIVGPRLAGDHQSPEAILFHIWQGGDLTEEEGFGKTMRSDR
jgi:hypothetical protein